MNEAAPGFATPKVMGDSSPMRPLYNHHVTAEVRSIGAIGEFAFRRFDFMLDPQDSDERKRKEAIRILRQIGYEPRVVTVEERR